MLSRVLGCAITAVNLVTATCVEAQPNRSPVANRPVQTAAVGYSHWSGFLAIFTTVPRAIVSYPANHKPGTIIISTGERRLYLVLGNGQAMKYGVGVGREGFTWSGVTTVSAKREWPDWTPPPEMLRRRPDLPRHMAGGLDNPLGARALYLGGTMYRIHGSNEPHAVGTGNTSGCIRLTNDDVIDLYDRVKVGATVIVQR